MDAPGDYEIRVQGSLSPCWSDWFDGLSLRIEPDGQTVLSGPIRDQSALVGLIGAIHALNLVLISVNRLPSPDPEPRGRG